VKHVVYAVAHPAAGFQIPDIPFDKLGLAEAVQILPLAREEVIETAHGLSLPQQGFHQVRSNEARSTGDQKSSHCSILGP
jgi:hypothetical protein